MQARDHCLASQQCARTSAAGASASAHLLRHGPCQQPIYIRAQARHLGPDADTLESPMYKLTEHDTVSEWLRRWTRNPLGSARRGSNPLGVALSKPPLRGTEGKGVGKVVGKG